MAPALPPSYAGAPFAGARRHMGRGVGQLGINIGDEMSLDMAPALPRSYAGAPFAGARRHMGRSAGQLGINIGNEMGLDRGLDIAPALPPLAGRGVD